LLGFGDSAGKFIWNLNLHFFSTLLDKFLEVYYHSNKVFRDILVKYWINLFV